VAWLWTDTLANLLMEHDGVAPELVRAWIQRPVGHRLTKGSDPLALARRLLDEPYGAANAGRAAAEAAALPSITRRRSVLPR
jgi:hypothetical protein